MDAEAVGGANICRLMVGDFELDATAGQDRRARVRPRSRSGRSGCSSRTQDATGPNRIPGMVERLVYLGNSVQVIVRLAVGTTIQALVQNVGDRDPVEAGHRRAGPTSRPRRCAC